METTGRLFVGVPLSKETRKTLKVQSWPGLSRYKNEKLVPVYNWHITLAFLGNIPKEQFEPLCQLIEVYQWTQAFNIGLKGFGAFPELDQGRVIWAGVNQGHDQIMDLGAEFRHQLDNLSISYDQKPFVPHITLCRLKHMKNLSSLKDNGKMKQEIKAKADRIVLYESLGNQQPYKEVLVRML